MILQFAYAYILGLFSILSPCTIIIIPVLIADINCRLRKILSFLAGIVITFSIVGLIAAISGKLITNFVGGNLYFFAGIVTLLAGLNMLGIFNLKWPSYFNKIKSHNHFILGLIYGGVALSCVGPLLASIVVYITASASVFVGLIMMLTFSLGFITPFLIFAFIITDSSVCKKIALHSGLIRKIGGIVLILASIYLLFVAFKGVL